MSLSALNGANPEKPEMSRSVSGHGDATKSASIGKTAKRRCARGGAEPRSIAHIEKSLDEITGEVVDAAYKLHKNIGPGLLESVYEVVLARDLERRGLRVARQEPVSFEYDGLLFRDCLRVDLLIESRVVVEIKPVEKLLPVHPRQLLTYIRLLRLSVGLLINFGAPTFREGIHRIVSDFLPSASPRLRVNLLPPAPPT